MILKALIIVLLLIITLIILVDVVPLINDWVKRIHIGRFDSKEIWKEHITKKGINWLTNTPKIKVTDNTRFVFWDIIRGNYSKAAIQYWQEASLLLGLTENIDESPFKEKIKTEVRKYLSSKFNKNGEWIVKPKHIDGAILAYAVMKLNFIEIDRFKPAMDYIWDLIESHIGEDGTVGYRKSMSNYRYVDTIGFICPFLISYGIKYKKQECVELAVRQIKQYEKQGMLTNYMIPSHAYKVDSKIPQGLYGWGRGLGWFAIGLIDSWKELPDSHEYKAELQKSVSDFAMDVIKFQQEQGNWNWAATRSESRPDSSATATLGWFLVNASQIHNISEDCLSSVEKSVNYLMGVTRKNGEVDFSQGDTKDIGVYSTLFNVLPFTQGFCLRIINYKSLR